MPPTKPLASRISPQSTVEAVERLLKEHQHGTLFVATFRCFLSATIQIFMLSFCFRCSPISTLFLKKEWRYLYLSMQWFYGIGNVERQMAI